MSQFQPSPPPLLNYAGPTVLQRPAFNARRAWAWKGEHLFRVYLTPQDAYFIRIGGAKNNAVAVHFGLIGGLIALWAQKNAIKKNAAKKALQNEDKPLDQLLAEHKRNHIIQLADISDSAIEKGGFWNGSTIRWTFQQAGEKKRVSCILEQTEDVDAAIQCLSEVFPALRVQVEYDEKKKKYVRISSQR